MPGNLFIWQPPQPLYEVLMIFFYPQHCVVRAGGSHVIVAAFASVETTETPNTLTALSGDISRWGIGGVEKTMWLPFWVAGVARKQGTYWNTNG